MSPIDLKLNGIRRRLRLFRFLDLLVKLMMAALLAALLALVALRLVRTEVEPLYFVGGLPLLALLAASAAALARRITTYDAAITADEKLGLAERLSSSVLLQGRSDPDGAIAALQVDAEKHSAVLDPVRDFRYKVPRLAKHLAWPFLALVAVYFLMPQYDLLAKPAPKEGEEATPAGEKARLRKEAAAEIQQLAKKAHDSGKLKILEDGKFAQNLERLSRDVALGTQDPKSAAAEMSRMNDQLRMRKTDIEKDMEPFKSIKGLQSAEKTQDLQKDLKSQDFNSAAQQARQLAQSMSNPGAMSSTEMAKTAQELKDLARQLKDNPQMAQAMQQAAEAMEKAAEAKKEEEKEQKQEQGDKQQAQQQQQQQGGQQNQQSGQSQQGDKQQASSDGKQEKNKGASGSDKQQPQQSQGGSPKSQQSQAAQQAQTAAEAAAQAMQQAAQSMESQQQAMQEMAQLDALQQQMGMTQSSMMNQNCQNKGDQGQSGGGSKPGQAGQKQGQGQGQGQQPGQGQQGQQLAQGGQSGDGSKPGGQNQFGDNTSEFKQGQAEGKGPGMGGPGIGDGGRRPDSGPMDVSFKDTLVHGELNEKGEIIATVEINAPAPRGESNVKYSNLYQAQKQKVADTMRNDVIPIGYRNQVRDYFEAINPEGKKAAPPAGK